MLYDNKKIASVIKQQQIPRGRTPSCFLAGTLYKTASREKHRGCLGSFWKAKWVFFSFLPASLSNEREWASEGISIETTLISVRSDSLLGDHHFIRSRGNRVFSRGFFSFFFYVFFFYRLRLTVYKISMVS